MDVQNYEQMQKTLDSIQELLTDWQNGNLHPKYNLNDAMRQVESLLDGLDAY